MAVGSRFWGSGFLAGVALVLAVPFIVVGCGLVRLAGWLDAEAEIAVSDCVVPDYEGRSELGLPP